MKAVLIRGDRKRYPVSPRLIPDRPTPAIRSLFYTIYGTTRRSQKTPKTVSEESAGRRTRAEFNDFLMSSLETAHHGAKDSTSKPQVRGRTPRRTTCSNRRSLRSNIKVN